MTEKNYPEEIYPPHIGIEVVRYVKKAYDIGMAHGKEQADPLAGFSNLTQAIQDGVRIDWEQLDGWAAKCVHPDMGALTRKFVRDYGYAEDNHNGWYVASPDGNSIGWGNILQFAWHGQGGWQLWVEGELPVKTRTADELEPGTGFRGEYLNGVCYDYIIYLDRDGRKRAICLSTGVRQDTSEIDVIEVYGLVTFQETKEEN